MKVLLLIALCIAAVFAAGGPPTSDIAKRGGAPSSVTCDFDAGNGLHYEYTCREKTYDLKFGKKEVNLGTVELSPIGCSNEKFAVDFEADFSFCNPWFDDNCESAGKCFKNIKWQVAEYDPNARRLPRELKQFQKALRRYGSYAFQQSFDDCGFGPFEETDPTRINFSWEDNASTSDPHLDKICTYMAGHSNLRVTQDRCGVNYDCLTSSHGSKNCVNFRSFFQHGDYDSYWQVEIRGGDDDVCGDPTVCDGTTPLCGSVIKTVPAWCVDSGDTLNSACRHGRLVSSVDVYEKWRNGDGDKFIIDNPGNLAAVNYLLNAKHRSAGSELGCGALTWKDYQHAIWTLLDRDVYETRCQSNGCGASAPREEVVQCIVDKAIDEGQNWTPDCEGVFGALLVASKCGECGDETTYDESGVQDLLVVLPVQEWGCKCVRQSKMKEGFVYPQCPDDGSPCFNPDICSTDCPEYAPMRNKHGECVVAPSKWKPYFEYCCDVTVTGELENPSPSPEPEPCPIY